MILAIGMFTTMLISCKDQEKESKKTEKKMTKRDLSITKENAYSDLFFDSMALVNFIQSNQLPDSIARRLTSFYNARNYQYAWFSSDGLTEQARGFWNLHNYQTNYANDSALYDKALQKKMDGMVMQDSLSINKADKELLNTEMTLTQHFITYARTNIADGYIKRKEMERFIPRMKVDPLYLADSLITKTHKNGKYYEDVNSNYKGLKTALKQYYDIAQKGGWPSVPASVAGMKKGAQSPELKVLKKRLELTGDMPVDSTIIFDEGLEKGISRFQVRHGYKPTGVVDAQLVKDMNVPVEERIKQLLLNMGRMQWMVEEPKGQMIVVNIPEFILHVKDGTKKVFDMGVVVGKDGHNTMMFTGDLNQIVFSPYWNLPSSIVKNEIMPAMAKNSNYLASHNMEMVSNEGDLPVIRQLPGEGNSLGKVKFLFPNSFNIYFHDTPAKSLFKKDKRAYSHGCIRLSEPQKMAEYLLKDDKTWTTEKINGAMNSGEEKYVKLDKPVHVLITYYTSWVDDEGLLHFADDIYDHDKKLTSKMFAVKKA